MAFAKDHPMEISMFREAIRSQFPDLRIETIRWFGEGRMSTAVLANGQLVFLFPKHQESANDMMKQIDILPRLSRWITAAVPQFEYVGTFNTMPFVGYRKLPGIILGEDELLHLPLDKQSLLAKELAEFLNQLHAFPVGQAKESCVPAKDLYKEYMEMYEKVSQRIFPLMEANLQQHVMMQFEHFFRNARSGYIPTLIHADLSPDHYVVDPIDHHLTGIIDFGDIQISDPDYEYTYILQDCGERFTRLVMEFRGQDQIEERLGKVSFFVMADYLLTALDGVDSGNQEWIDEGIVAIREMEGK